MKEKENIWAQKFTRTRLLKVEPGYKSAGRPVKMQILNQQLWGGPSLLHFQQAPR